MTYCWFLGGGTTDYAVAVFFEALRKGSYECYLKPDTMMPMMHINDCLRSLLEFMTVPPEKLKRRVYNVTAMSFTPEQLFDKIAKYVPELHISYRPDSRQAIADSWPQVFDDSEARFVFFSIHLERLNIIKIYLGRIGDGNMNTTWTS